MLPVSAQLLFGRRFIAALVIDTRVPQALIEPTPKRSVYVGSSPKCEESVRNEIFEVLHVWRLRHT